jgi:hypothetical protein
MACIPDFLSNAGATFEVKYENFQYSLVASQFDIKYESADYAAGSIMTFVEVADIYKYFPGSQTSKAYADFEYFDYEGK